MQHKNICLTVLLSSLGAALLRFLSIMFFTEKETGFTKPDKTSVVIQLAFMVIIIIAAVVIFFICKMLSKRQPIYAPDLTKLPALTIMTFVMGITMLVMSAFTYISNGSGGVFSIIGVLLYLLAGLSFIIYGTTRFTKKTLPIVFSLFPIFAMMYRLIDLFLGFNGTSVIYENSFDLVYLAAILLFFLYHGKAVSNVSIRATSRMLFPLTAICTMLCAACTLPYYAIYILGLSGKAMHSSHLNIDFLIYGIYAVVFTLSLYSKKMMPKPHVPSVTALETVNDETKIPQTNFYLSDDEK